MTDANIQNEGECQECLRHEKDGQLLCDRIAKLEKEIEHMKSCSFNDACEIGELKQENDHLGNIAHEVNRMMTEVAKLEQENKELLEALTNLYKEIRSRFAPADEIAFEHMSIPLNKVMAAARKLLEP